MNVIETQIQVLERNLRVIKLQTVGSVEEIVCRLVWHETYHLGQLEQLRQLAGTNDKVI